MLREPIVFKLKEKFYEENEFDVNILPLVVEIPIGKRIDARFVNILNYHFGPENQISDVGFQLIMPVFFTASADAKSPSYGLYLGPIYGWGRNFLNKHGTHTVGGEAGYQFKAGKAFTVSVGLQLRGSYLTFDNTANEWQNHFGIKVNLAWWTRLED